MKTEITITLERGRVKLVAHTALDGSINFLETLDAETGRHVALSSGDKWLAISAIGRAVRLRAAS